MTPRPWLRHRRTVMASVAGALVLVLAACAVLLFVPTFRIADVEVSGTGYVDPEQVSAAAAPALGSSIALAPLGEVRAAVQEIPGIRTAEVRRSWPDGLSITVTERDPLAVVTAADGSTSIVDAEGRQLPPEAAEGQNLAALAVDADSTNPEGSLDAMIAVLGSMPRDLRAAVGGMSAGSPSDVRFTIGLEDGRTKTVIWGDARDAELKARVLPALLDQPGTEIDVSSPVAPVTR